MDPATLIGIAAGALILVIVNALEGGSLSSLVLLPPMLLVFGVTIAVTIAGGTLGDLRQVPRSLQRAFRGRAPQTDDVVPTVVQLAERARRDGLLAIEEDLATVDDPFLVKGLRLAIDGTDPEELRELMEAEIDAKRVQDRQRAKFFADAGGYAPTIGIIGTVMSLVHVLENLADPEKLGHSIAAAFLATLWGVLSANIIWLPIAARLRRLSELEGERMEVVVEGVVAIQAGSNPRIIAQRLNTLLRVESEAA
ncbi:motility protein A [Aeromicrobium phragmitis]|uniref:Motility protein A n=1 Tax=Aeromicrobium phragmitis TaxID=2478914 RepID=A0A3L8PM59_9ACTN|nr:MotA/TolQ/ExbB proton channel family protein [Aeromicrobium phragmitis]RLV56476.1 motility protein A [Aeromicrobium phragmitis]